LTDLADVLGQRLDPAGRKPPDEDAVLTVSSEDLEQLWLDLMPDTYAARRGLDTFLQAVQADADQAPGADLEFRPGGWQVNLRRGAVQTIIAGALIAGLLAVLGATQIPAALATAVVPLLFDIQHVTLTPGQAVSAHRASWPQGSPGRQPHPA